MHFSSKRQLVEPPADQIVWDARFPNMRTGNVFELILYELKLIQHAITKESGAQGSSKTENVG